DSLLIVLYDGVGDGKQRRLIAEVPFPRALLLPQLALMFLTPFHRYKKGDEEPDHETNNGEREAEQAEKEDLLGHVATSGWTNFLLLLLLDAVPEIGFGSVISPAS